MTDDFEALGGDSEDRTRVAELLAVRSGRALLAGELLARPTIERQAELVREAEAPSGTPLRLLREGTAPAQLFLFHPGGGDTLVYRQLIDQLDPSIGVWGLDRLPGALSVEERAEHYVELVRGVQELGPYLLAGWSFGGALAYETALRLGDLGEAVELVALIDTILPLPDLSTSRRPRSSRSASGGSPNSSSTTTASASRCPTPGWPAWATSSRPI